MQKRTVIGSMEIEVLDADALARLERARPPPPTFSMRLVPRAGRTGPIFAGVTR